MYMCLYAIKLEGKGMTGNVSGKNLRKLRGSWEMIWKPWEIHSKRVYWWKVRKGCSKSPPIEFARLMSSSPIPQNLIVRLHLENLPSLNTFFSMEKSKCYPRSFYPACLDSRLQLFSSKLLLLNKTKLLLLYLETDTWRHFLRVYLMQSVFVILDRCIVIITTPALSK